MTQKTINALFSRDRPAAADKHVIHQKNFWPTLDSQDIARQDRHVTIHPLAILVYLSSARASLLGGADRALEICARSASATTASIFFAGKGPTHVTTDAALVDEQASTRTHTGAGNRGLSIHLAASLSRLYSCAHLAKATLVRRHILEDRARFHHRDRLT